jgi:hypothetical protein
MRLAFAQRLEPAAEVRLSRENLLNAWRVVVADPPSVA